MFLKLRIVCTNCGVEKHRDEFYRRTQGGLHRQCKTCIIVQNVARVQADPVPRNAYMRGYLKDVRSGVRRNAAAEFLRAEKAKPCMDCGQCFSPECMQFDHVRGVKVLALGNMKTYGLEKVKAEVAKCELVCSNCHAIRTHQHRRNLRESRTLVSEDPCPGEENLLRGDRLPVRRRRGRGEAQGT